MKTLTEQRPQECEYYLSVATCEFQHELMLEPETTCVLFCGIKHCPDFTPKHKQKELERCRLRCGNGDCLKMKMDAIERGVYMDVKCQWDYSHMKDCPDFTPKPDK